MEANAPSATLCCTPETTALRAPVLMECLTCVCVCAHARVYQKMLLRMLLSLAVDTSALSLHNAKLLSATLTLRPAMHVASPSFLSPTFPNLGRAALSPAVSTPNVEQMVVLFWPETSNFSQKIKRLHDFGEVKGRKETSTCRALDTVNHLHSYGH